MTIVDSHVHIFTADSPAYPWDKTSPIQPDFAAPVETLLEAMTEARVDHAVLIQHSCYGYDNRYIIDCARRYPEKFCTVIKVDPLDPASPDQLRRLVEEQGAQGLRLQPARDPDSTWLNAPETYRLWEIAAKLNIVVGILLDPRQLAQADDIVRRYPEVRVIIDHMGRVNIAEPPDGERFRQLLALARFPNTFVKVSGFYAFSRQPFPYPDLAPYVLALWQAFGRERLLWATDFPLLVRAGEPYAQALTILHHHLPHLTEDDSDWLMSKTALRLFHFP